MRISYVFHTYLIRVHTYKTRMRYGLKSFKVRHQTNFELTSYKFNKDLVSPIEWENTAVYRILYSLKVLYTVKVAYLKHPK